jgi:hypothetical protein
VVCFNAAWLFHIAAGRRPALHWEGGCPRELSFPISVSSVLSVAEILPPFHQNCPLADVSGTCFNLRVNIFGIGATAFDVWEFGRYFGSDSKNCSGRERQLWLKKMII